MTKRIWLDAGHGGHDPGAVANGLQEKKLVLDMVLYAKRYLEANYKGVVVGLTRSTDVFYSLSQRARKANDWKADVFVSAHINAGGGTGFETFAFPGAKGETRRFQQALHDEILTTMRAFGQVTDRGLKQKNLAVVRETRMPAVLTENLFIDTKQDAAKLKDNDFVKAVGEAHARGIAKYLGLQEGENDNPAYEPKPKAYYEKGDSGPKVKEIQQKLIKAGFPLPKYGADGHYGDETVAAVESFQKKYGLAVDGIAGKNTLAKLEEVYKEVTTPKDTRKYRLMTGAFPNAEALTEALERLKKDYGWLTYEKADSTDLNPTYRIVTGTFTGKDTAEKFAEEFRKEYGWTIYVKEA
ncbi:N-acetylmuramoyl-L-alanine amidase [Priestia endophytica]|uniref:N-acetylmuramoyl-L-alanine amidase n=1 Tax=Priestia endophytica TaxID=135735 RepID=UPI002281D17A|nr:N-acetylmuramoyl-L-alanine amidase [Priestia endophytica]MCY8234814.1 N-acetylmuramoyl-L-alanine amidase [Priestia endophytica]